MNIQNIISNKVSQALINLNINTTCKLSVCQTSKIEFGNYQINGIISEAKKLGISPVDLANRILSHLNLDGIARRIEISVLGFINIFLDPIFLAYGVEKTLKSKLLDITKPEPQTIIVDYSGPNVAKEMHVGHLRSTIIGDSVVRTLELLGHRVIRANHLGDWGTQFGMLIAYLDKHHKDNIDKIDLIDLENFYLEAKKCYDKNQLFANLARKYVVKLQNGDTHLLHIWRKLVNITILKNQIIYNRLNVTLTHKDIMGESIYNAMLPDIIRDLQKKGLAVESKGAIVVFLDFSKNGGNNSIGVIIRKKDGGYLYTTTDIACVKYRYEILHADRILYYVDSRQHQHFMQVWTIARKAGYVPEHVSLEHHMLGMMLNKHGQPFKTRTGSTIKLIDLLDEALNRARNLIIGKNPNMPTHELEKLANILGIGALKYADLSRNRIKNYIFDFDKILTFEGNTAPYMQYAYTRATSMFRKAKIDNNTFANSIMKISENHEILLAIHLLQFEEAINTVARDGTPHVMCTYLYNLAGLFSKFYEECPILNAKNDTIRISRLKLAKLTAKTLKLGLNILGIETVERM